MSPYYTHSTLKEIRTIVSSFPRVDSKAQKTKLLYIHFIMISIINVHLVCSLVIEFTRSTFNITVITLINLFPIHCFHQMLVNKFKADLDSFWLLALLNTFQNLKIMEILSIYCSKMKIETSLFPPW